MRDKKTNKIIIRPAPIQVLTRQVKALKTLVPPPSTSLERMESRNILGNTFGTKKAQKAIRAAERNKMDVSAMEGVTGHLQDAIEAGTSALPTKGEPLSALFSDQVAHNTCRRSEGCCRPCQTNSTPQRTSGHPSRGVCTT